ncbi:MAG: hypothetical protein WAT93_12320 [Pontixanthobacter sp.]
MSKGEGGGVSIGYGSNLPVSGEKRVKLKHATEIDTHLTQKNVRDAARALVEKKGRKKSHLTNAEKKADKQARKKYRAAPKEVVVEMREGGELKGMRIVLRS